MKELFKSAVYMIIRKDDKILLQKRKGSAWEGYYALPSGHIDEGENQYDALVREAKEELGIVIDPDKILNSYTVLRRNYYKFDGKRQKPYIDFYFEISEYEGIPTIMEEDKCEELIWSDIDDLKEPFINYEGEFLNDMSMTTFDCYTAGAYVKKLKK